jgi:splicing factor 3A subunit 2
MAHRDWGSKTGGGVVASADHEALARKERLRQLASDTVDLSKDPYFMRNHLGSCECKLCLTLHSNEGNYLAHTQGRRHQNNLQRRAAVEARKLAASSRGGGAAGLAKLAAPRASGSDARRRALRIGRPGYQITKQRESWEDGCGGQLSLLFQMKYPEITAGLQPRHRFMSAFEQRKEKPDKRYQYLLFAADPYETVAFKIPNRPIDKEVGKFYTNWDREKLVFTLQLFFEATKETSAANPASVEPLSPAKSHVSLAQRVDEPGPPQLQLPALTANPFDGM